MLLSHIAPSLNVEIAQYSVAPSQQEATIPNPISAMSTADSLILWTGFAAVVFALAIVALIALHCHLSNPLRAAKRRDARRREARRAYYRRRS